MDWTLIIVALIAAVPSTIVAFANFQKLSGIRDDVSAVQDSANEVTEQVRMPNGRTLGQTVEDQANDIDELRGDVMELAIQFARHMGDQHTHDMVRKMRQQRRDRTEMGRELRQLGNDMEET